MTNFKLFASLVLTATIVPTLQRNPVAREM